MNGLFNSKQEQLPLVLQRFVRDLKPYLEMPINEIMFNKEKEFYLAKGSSMRLVADERFSQDYLITFCEQLANFRNQMFDLKHPQLATSIPYTQFRVHAYILVLLLIAILRSTLEYLVFLNSQSRALNFLKNV